MGDKETKRKNGRPRKRDMESLWDKQREWSKSYYDRNRDKVCIKQQIRYYRNKLIDADKADIARLEGKIAELEAELEALEKGDVDIEEK